MDQPPGLAAGTSVPSSASLLHVMEASLPQYFPCGKSSADGQHQDRYILPQGGVMVPLKCPNSRGDILEPASF